MKRIVKTHRPFILALAVVGSLSLSAHAETPAQPAVKSPGAPQAPGAPAAKDSASYNLGLIFGSQLSHGGLTGGVSMDALTRGIRDGMQGRQPTQQNKQEASELLTGARQNLGDHNKLLARQFLAENAKRPGITSTSSGLQYSVIKAGDAKAKTPDDTSQVTVAYRGTLLDGTEFDSSATHGKAAIFRMNSVIPGWKEALHLMTPGAKWRVFVPPELGYDLHSPPNIPPGSLLTFEIDLLRVSAAGDFGQPGPVSGSVRSSPATSGAPR